MDVWAMTDAERERLVAKLQALKDVDWSRPTLCGNWTVRHVVAHLIALQSLNTTKFLVGITRSKFNFDALQAHGIEAHSGGQSPVQMLRALESRVHSRAKPPGPAATMLGEVLIHGEDIFRAQGDSFGEHPIDHVLAVANFYKKSNLIIGTKKRISRVTLRMTDADWSHGSGPEVSGPAISIVMAMVGRKIALGDLKGEGVSILAGRT